MKERIQAISKIGWRGWLYALAHSVVGGVATTLAAAVTIVDLRTNHSWEEIGSLAVASAFISLLLYLRESPIPPAIVQAPTDPVVNEEKTQSTA